MMFLKGRVLAGRIVGLFLFFASASAAAADLNTAPDCSGASASPATLWPPNHKLESIAIDGITDPDGDSVEIAVQCVLQDEPLNANGDGNTEPDADGIGSGLPKVRAERSGNRNGRVYHIDFLATDSRGASCGGEVTVAVPHSKKSSAVDDGRLHASVPSPYACGVHDPNNAPLIHSTPVTFAQEGQSYRYEVIGHDPDGDVLVYS